METAGRKRRFDQTFDEHSVLHDDVSCHLTVVGYAVKLFPGDSAAAAASARGSLLVSLALPGSSDLRIDRFDVRATLSADELRAVSACVYADEQSTALDAERYWALTSLGQTYQSGMSERGEKANHY